MLCQLISQFSIILHQPSINSSFIYHQQECESGEKCCKIYYNSQAGSPFQKTQQVRCRSGNQKCVPAYLCVNGELSNEGLRYAARLLPVSTPKKIFLLFFTYIIKKSLVLYHVHECEFLCIKN